MFLMFSEWDVHPLFFSQYPSPVYYDFAVTVTSIETYKLHLSIYNLHKVRLGERENKIFL